MQINSYNISQFTVAPAGGPVKLTTFASDLGWKPGAWPSQFVVVPKQGDSLAAPLTFSRTTPVWHDDELGGYNYVSQNAAGVTAVVFND